MSGKSFTISKTFNAPTDVMWKAWTHDNQLKQWFGPKGISMPKCQMDLKVDGMFLYCMVTPDDTEMWGRWIFTEIKKPEKLVMITSFSDKEGKITRHPLAEAWPLEMLSTVTFTEKNGKTTVNVEWNAINETPEERKFFDASHDSMTQGWTGTFEQLEEFLTRNKI